MQQKRKKTRDHQEKKMNKETKNRTERDRYRETEEPMEERKGGGQSEGRREQTTTKRRRTIKRHREGQEGKMRPWHVYHTRKYFEQQQKQAEHIFKKWGQSQNQESANAIDDDNKDEIEKIQE